MVLIQWEEIGIIAYHTGGRVQGFGTGDIVPAFLEPGEFVVKKDVAKQYEPELQRLNEGGIYGKINERAKIGSAELAGRREDKANGRTLWFNSGRIGGKENTSNQQAKNVYTGSDSEGRAHVRRHEISAGELATFDRAAENMAWMFDAPLGLVDNIFLSSQVFWKMKGGKRYNKGGQVRGEGYGNERDFGGNSDKSSEFRNSIGGRTPRRLCNVGRVFGEIPAHKVFDRKGFCLSD